MRRDRFLKLHKDYAAMLHQKARHWLDYDDSREVVAQMTRRLLENKVYKRIAVTKLEGFLVRNLVFNVREFMKANANKPVSLDHVKDSFPENSSVAIGYPVNMPLVECPFCFKADLNQYGGCALCYTIVPSHMTLHRKQMYLEELSLAVSFDFNTPIDVQRAIAKLSPREQMVVKAIGLGNESLESLSEITKQNGQTLWRAWLSAKEKLQESLKEYAEKPLSKRGEKAFSHALQVIDIM